MHHLTSHDLPEDVARRVEAQLADGRFSDVESVIRAGIEALDEREAMAREWVAYLRCEAADGFAELDKPGNLRGSAAEVMAVLRAEVAKRGKA